MSLQCNQANQVQSKLHVSAVENLERVVVWQIRWPGVNEKLHQPSIAADDALDHQIPPLGATSQAGAADFSRFSSRRQGWLHDLLQFWLQKRRTSTAQQGSMPYVGPEVRQQRNLQNLSFRKAPINIDLSLWL